MQGVPLISCCGSAQCCYKGSQRACHAIAKTFFIFLMDSITHLINEGDKNTKD